MLYACDVPDQQIAYVIHFLAERANVGPDVCEVATRLGPDVCEVGVHSSAEVIDSGVRRAGRHPNGCADGRNPESGAGPFSGCH